MITVNAFSRSKFLKLCQTLRAGRGCIRQGGADSFLWKQHIGEVPPKLKLLWNGGDIQMPFSFHVDKDTGVIHVQATGEVNDAELIELSDRLGHDTAFVAGYPILCDGSTLTAVLISSSLIESLGRTARSHANLVAIIAPSPVAFGLSRMYQILSDPEDTRMHVFPKAEEAMAWLRLHSGTELRRQARTAT